MRLLLCALLTAMPAFAPAAVIGAATGPGGAKVEFHDDGAGVCLAPARYAVHIATDGQRVGGCYMIEGGMVRINFLDGDRGAVPVQAIRPSDPA
jgi:hypothetical protein